MLQRVTERRDMAKDKPASVINLIIRCILIGQVLATDRRSFELPIVQAVKECLGHIHHRLQFWSGQVTVLVENKIRHCFCNAGSFEWRISEWTTDQGLSTRDDALAQETEEVVVDFLRVLVVFPLHTHKEIFHVNDCSQEIC